MTQTLCDLCHQAGPDPQMEIDGDIYCASCAEKLIDECGRVLERYLRDRLYDF